MFKKIKKFYYSKSNFESIQLGKTPQWKWFCFSLSFTPYFHFSYINYFFGCAITTHEIYLIPTIRFNLPRNYYNLKDELKNFAIYIYWLNLNITLTIGHWFYKPFKGYRTEDEIKSYKEYLDEVKKMCE